MGRYWHFRRLAAALAVVTVMASASFAQTVIKINSFNDLRKIGRDAGYPLSGNYELAADIDASSSRSQAFEPIGPFSGTFDGKGHTINGLYIKLPARQEIGLFGNTVNAEIRDIILVADSIIGELTVGALVGSATATTIQNCHTRGYIGGKGSVGGIVGYAGDATITNSGSKSDCYASGYQGTGWEAGSVGGLVGHAESGTVITASYATGNVTSLLNNAGGLVGYSDGVIINKCYSTGNVSGTEDVGGFIGNANGFNASADTISNCYSSGNVSNSNNYVSNIGGFAGHSPGTVMINCYSTGRVNGGRGFGMYIQQTSNCFWDIQTSNQPDTLGGEQGKQERLGLVTGKTTAEMMRRATFTGWDFETVWDISEGNDYPKLRGAIGYLLNLTYTAGTGGRIIGTSSQFVKRGADGSTVVAMADAGYVFAKWSDGVTASERIDRNVTSDIYVTAVFTPADPRVLSYSAGAGGKISGQVSQTIPVGGNGSSVTAVPDTGYIFAEWSDGVKTAIRTDNNVQSNITVTASFTKVYTLRYTAGVGGYITGSGTQTVSPGSSGSAVTATPNSGYRFVSWSDGVTTAARTDANVSADISVTATFARVEYTLNYELGTGGREIVGSPQQTVLPGASGTEVYVLAETGYTFARWSDGSIANPRTDRDVQDDITVKAYFADAEGNVSVLTPNRVVPQVKPKEEAVVIAPAIILAGEFTAGPNPVGRGLGSVGFFRQGKRVTNTELRIYDATGNAVGKVKITDNALGNQARRKVGSWDLRDKSGRLVSEGTYLVKGVLKTSDGKKEKVSVIVGVR